MGNSPSIFCSPSSRPGEDDEDDEREHQRQQQVVENGRYVFGRSVTKKQVSSLSMNSNLPVPKHLLWGCSTVEEHYDYIKQSLELLEEKQFHSHEGLKLLGFEYRVVHGTHTCDCGFSDVLSGGEFDDRRQHAATGDRGSNGGSDDEVLPPTSRPSKDEDDDDGHDDGGFFMDDDDEDDRDDEDDDDGENDDGSSTDSERMIFDTTMVPIGISINEHLRLSQRSTTSSLQDEVNAVIARQQNQQHQQKPSSYFVDLKGGSNHENDGGGRRRESRKSTNNKNPKRMPKSMSSTSLFSLATHYSRSSTAASTSAESVYSTPSNMGDDDMEYPMLNHTCNNRLFHVPSNTMITERNFKDYIADGKYYDTVATFCMEYAQELMIQYGNLQEWQTTTTHNTTTTTSNDNDDIEGDTATIRAFISKNLNISNPEEADGEEHDDDDNHKATTTSRTATTTTPATSTVTTTSSTNNNNTFLIVTGKGKVGAGIFSRRLLMTHGIEAASALFFIKQVALALAVHNQSQPEENDAPPVSNIVLLDPNCLGPQKAMDVFEICCDELVFQHYHHDDKDDKKNGSDDAPNSVYVLAHSMAGSQLVRYILRKSEPEPTQDGSSANSGGGGGGDEDDHQQQQREQIADRYLSQINSVAFTDSNHNINWVKKKLPNVSKFLQSPRCLYIKSHKVHEKQKYLGELHHDCEYWKHRFGTIKTIWAGTKEHALTNYTSRHHILDHLFDNDD